ncbi:MAG: hypothetical protein QOH83_576 [Solirubrobacteraceae bacterium]|nr:hypothetical protein [Solirubrobacteraceae bacterium]
MTDATIASDRARQAEAEADLGTQERLTPDTQSSARARFVVCCPP